MTAVARLSGAAQIWGTVSGTDGASIRLAGLTRLARLGDRVEIETADGRLPGEIIAINGAEMTALLMSQPKGLSAGQRAVLVPDAELMPSDAWLGQVLDAFGKTTSDQPTSTPLPVDEHDRVPMRSELRRPLGGRLTTGLAALDTFLPLCRGQRLGVFAGSGVGKSRLMSDLALGVSADVVVVGHRQERVFLER